MRGIATGAAWRGTSGSMDRVLAIGVCLVCSARRFAGVGACALVASVAAAGPWADARAGVLAGRLDNGVRYAVVPHGEAGGAIGVTLRIGAGLVHEREGERGWAVLAERVSLARAGRDPRAQAMLERLGVTLAPGRSASAGRAETVFWFEAPSSGLGDALSVLAGLSRPGIGGGELLGAQVREIEAERAARSDVDSLLRGQLLEQLSPGSGLGERPALGVAEDLAGATPEALHAFIERVWRPERMSVVVAGVVDAERTAAAIGAAFGKIDSPGEAVEPAWRVAEEDGLRAVVLHDPRVVDDESAWIKVGPARGPAAGPERFAEILLDRYASEAVRARLASRSGVRGVDETQVYDLEAPGVLRVRETAAGGAAGRWRELIGEVARVRRSLVEVPLSDAEVDAARRRVLDDLRGFAEREPGSAPADVSRRAAALLGLGVPVVSFVHEHAAAVRLDAGIADDQIRAHASSLYSTDSGVVVVKTGGVRPAAAAVLAAVESALEGDVGGVVPSGAVELPRLVSEGVGARSVTAHPASGAVTLRLRNGVVVHHQRISGIGGGVSIRVSLGGGLREESVLNRGVTAATAGVLDGLWVSGMRPEGVRAALAGAGLRHGVAVDDRALILEASCGPGDVEAGARLLGAMLSTGVIGAEALDAWREEKGAEIEALRARDEAVLERTVARAVTPGDPAWSRALTREDLARLDADSVSAWWARLRDGAPAEIAIVGEIDRDEALGLAARVAGALGERALPAARELTSEDGSIARVVREALEPSAERAVAAVVVSVPGHGRLDELRACVVASRIVRERAERRLRGVWADAEVSVALRPGDGGAGTGTLRLVARVDAGAGEAALRELRAVIDEMATGGVLDDEARATREVLAQAADRALRNPAYWSRWLAGSVREGRTIDGIWSIRSDYAGLEAEAIGEAFSAAVAHRGTLGVVLEPDGE